MAYEDLTPDLIIESMLNNVDDGIDKRVGSVTQDLLYPAAIELSNAYLELDTVLAMGFAKTAEAPYLDMRTAEFGVNRKPALKAQGTVTLTGPNDTFVPAGTRMQTANDIFFVTVDDALLTGGMVTVEAEAEFAGSLGNVAVGTIEALTAGDLYGIVSVINDVNFDGGVDEEGNAQLLQRYMDRVQRPGTSGNGNHYRQWALEVPGVGDAKVYPEWKGGGTVKVILLDNEKSTPAPTIIQAAKDYIETVRPVGPEITVEGVIEVPINIEAQLVLSADSEGIGAYAEIVTLINDYLKSLAFTDDTIVRLSKIASLIMSSPSVVDYMDLKLNGNATNVVIPDGSVAVIGQVDFE